MTDRTKLRELLTKAQSHHVRLVNAAFRNGGKEKPRFSIPANRDTDSDLIVGDALRGALALLDELEQDND